MSVNGRNRVCRATPMRRGIFSVSRDQRPIHQSRRGTAKAKGSITTTDDHDTAARVAVGVDDSGKSKRRKGSPNIATKR